MMRALESMISKMNATGIYKLNSDTLINYELKSYAAGLDMAFDDFITLQKESFIGTACGYGLSNMEKMLKIGKCSTEDDRRNRIIQYCAITHNSFTKSDMENVFKIRGHNAEISEYPKEKKIYVNCMEVNENDKKEIINTAKMFLPVHLDVELDFRYISWNNIDNKNNTFDKLESLELTWNDIDNFDNELLKI